MATASKRKKQLFFLVGTGGFIHRFRFLRSKFLINYLKRNDFTVFGWYRIILGIILIGYWVYRNVI